MQNSLSKIYDAHRIMTVSKNHDFKCSASLNIYSNVHDFENLPD